jgi:hypothetical protein
MTLTVNGKNGPNLLDAQKVNLGAEGAGELAGTSRPPRASACQTMGIQREAARKAATARTPAHHPADRPRRAGHRAAGQLRPRRRQVRSAGRTQPPVRCPAKAARNRSVAQAATPPPGLKRFFEDYPFACLEQKTSIAVGLHDEARWQQIVDSLPGYLDSNGLAATSRALSCAGSATLTAYLLDLVTLAGFADPGRQPQRMLRPHRLRRGRIKTNEWSPPRPTRLLTPPAPCKR